jgi:hypothetical protein
MAVSRVPIIWSTMNDIKRAQIGWLQQHLEITCYTFQSISDRWR